MPAVVALFWAFGALAVGAALLCITRRNPVASALWLVVTLFAVAALFVMLDAQFVAVLQILVYAGAIMVLFLFVIMLLNLGRGGPNDLKGPVGLAVAAGLGAVLFLELRALARPPRPARAPWPAPPPSRGWWPLWPAPCSRRTSCPSRSRASCSSRRSWARWCSPNGGCDAARARAARRRPPLRSRGRRRPAAPQRDRHFHVRRADAQRGEPDVRRLRAAAGRGGPDLRVLRPGRRRRR